MREQRFAKIPYTPPPGFFAVCDARNGKKRCDGKARHDCTLQHGSGPLVHWIGFFCNKHANRRSMTRWIKWQMGANQ